MRPLETWRLQRTDGLNIDDDDDDDDNDDDETDGGDEDNDDDDDYDKNMYCFRVVGRMRGRESAGTRLQFTKHALTKNTKRGGAMWTTICAT